MLREKLKTARKRAGLSLRDLQAKTGNAVSAQAIGKYERGEMRPGEGIVEALAAALGVSKEFLASEDQIKLGAIEFRENFIRSKKEESQVEAKILDHVKKYLEIEELLKIETVDWNRPREFPFIVRDEKDVELAALKLRDDWRLGNDPIPNLAEFLEDRGIKVVLIELPDSVAGVTCFIQRDKHPSIPVIVVNNVITVERQRFTLAHELGHLVMEIDGNSEKEAFCNRFASAFLMPDRILWATLGKNRKTISLGELVSLKLFFGVSIQAIVYRCKDLNIINKASYQAFYRAFAREGWLKPPYAEPGKLKPEATDRFRRFCFRAVAEELISLEKAEELLGIPTTEILIEMNAPQLKP